MITKSVFSFLKKLDQNNNREWFTDHKEAFKDQQAVIKSFAGLVLENLNQHDEIEKLEKSLNWMRLK